MDKEFIEIAIENIIPPFVEIKGSLNLSINVENGVEIIKQANNLLKNTHQRRMKYPLCAFMTVHQNTESC